MYSKTKTISGYGGTVDIDATSFRGERHSDLQTSQKHSPLLARGQGLSYGDCSLSKQVFQTERLNRFVAYQKETQQLTVESGVTFKDTLRTATNIMLPVYPGTVHASIGGGVANDVHGKNHFNAGSLGCHITFIELHWPGETITVSQRQHPELFKATIGGLGLTGVIGKVGLQLQEPHKAVTVKQQPLATISEAINTLVEAAKTHQYAALWSDWFQQGRSILTTANPINAPVTDAISTGLSIPFKPLLSCVRPTLMRVFNQLYYAHQRRQPEIIMPFCRFNNPLDSIKHFNYLYGRPGFYQFQCVIPLAQSNAFADFCLHHFKQTRTFPNLSVTKLLGDKAPGILSFAKAGVSFAFDFNATDKSMVEYLTRACLDFDGRVYLAKDSVLDKATFEAMYPNHDNFKAVLARYPQTKQFRSLLSERLGVHHD